ncbi:MAG: hypothetical protein AAB538_03260 [Patescibacteria group bacterium]
MKKEAVWGLGALTVAAVFAVAVWGTGSRAAGAKYTFTARVIVTGVDQANKSFKADVTKAVPTKAKDDIEGRNVEFKAGTAKVVKVFNGLDKAATYKNIQIGQELGIKGTAKDNDTYELSFVRIHDRGFKVVGLLQKHDETNRELTILVTSSTYKPTTYKKGTLIVMKYFESNSTFYSKSTKTPVSFSVVKANNQKVQVTGTFTSSNTWEVASLIDGYTGN